MFPEMEYSLLACLVMFPEHWLEGGDGYKEG
jgi:hypothetical protein